jgi:hypothetical protein
MVVLLRSISLRGCRDQVRREKGDLDSGGRRHIDERAPREIHILEQIGRDAPAIE